MPGDSARDDVQAAFDSMSERESDSVRTQDVRPERTEREEPENEFDTPAERAQRARDNTGRYSPRTPAKPTQEDHAPTDEAGSSGLERVNGAAPAPTPTAAPADAPPVSWKAEEREHWAGLTPQAKAAVLRRERETDAVLRTSATSRQFAEEFARIIQPHAQLIQAEQSTPLKAVQYLLNTSAELRTAAPGRKAALVADLIKNYKVDVEALDSALRAQLDGTASPQHQLDPVISQLEERFKPAMTYIEQLRQREQQAQESQMAEARGVWEEFSQDPQYPLAEEVKEDMAWLMNSYANKNKALSLQDAYKLATMRQPANPGQVQDVQAQQLDPAQRTKAARRAAEAAASLSGKDGAPLREDEARRDGSLRSDVLSSIEKLSSARR